MANVKIGKYNVNLTNPDAVWFEKPTITKEQIVNYYIAIALVMLPYIKNRPLTMHRFPEGITHEGFYHKNTPDYFPSWIKRCPIKTVDGKTVNYLVANHAATLAYIANQGCITPHVFLSKVDKLDYPDQMIFDLDPPGENFELVRFAATCLRTMLEELGLVPFVKTTGSRGLHVVVPIRRTMPFDDVRACARTIATQLVQAHPKDMTTEIRKEKRKGRLYIDVMRNAAAQTTVAPYAVRARPSAPVATPLYWHELDDVNLRSDTYTIATVFDRLEVLGDPWLNMHKHAHSLSRLLRAGSSFRLR